MRELQAHCYLEYLEFRLLAPEVIQVQFTDCCFSRGSDNIIAPSREQNRAFFTSSKLEHRKNICWEKHARKLRHTAVCCMRRQFTEPRTYFASSGKKKLQYLFCSFLETVITQF